MKTSRRARWLATLLVAPMWWATGCLTRPQPLSDYAAAAVSPELPALDDVPEWVPARLRQRLTERLAEELGLQVIEATEPARGALWLEITSLSYREPSATAFALDRGFGRRAGLTAQLVVWDSERKELLLEREATGDGAGEWPPADSLEEARLLRMIAEIVDWWLIELREAGAGGGEGEPQRLRTTGNAGVSPAE